MARSKATHNPFGNSSRHSQSPGAFPGDTMGATGHSNMAHHAKHKPKVKKRGKIRQRG